MCAKPRQPVVLAYGLVGRREPGPAGMVAAVVHEKSAGSAPWPRAHRPFLSLSRHPFVL